MWDYTDNVKNHFLQPKHAGEIDQPDMDATVGNITCGDALRLMVKLDDQKRIVDAKFQTFGCASAIASSDVLIDLILGKTVDEAAAVTNQDIARTLGGLPSAKMHCSVMGMEALQKAISEWRGEPFAFEEHGHVVCQCFGVTDKLIEKVVRDEGLRTVDEVTHFTKAGGGCGACHGKIREIIAAVLGEAEPAPATAQPAARPMTNLQRMRKVEDVIEKEIRPILRNDGGDIELVDVAGTKVQVAFRGSCAWCRARDFTLGGTVGAKLREMVDPDIEVEDVSETLT
jgi:NifU-like protein